MYFSYNAGSLALSGIVVSNISVSASSTHLLGVRHAVIVVDHVDVFMD